MGQLVVVQPAGQLGLVQLGGNLLVCNSFQPHLEEVDFLGSLLAAVPDCQGRNKRERTKRIYMYMYTNMYIRVCMQVYIKYSR